MGYERSLKDVKRGRYTPEQLRELRAEIDNQLGSDEIRLEDVNRVINVVLGRQRVLMDTWAEMAWQIGFVSGEVVRDEDKFPLKTLDEAAFVLGNQLNTADMQDRKFRALFEHMDHYLDFSIIQEFRTTAANVAVNKTNDPKNVDVIHLKELVKRHPFAVKHAPIARQLKLRPTRKRAQMTKDVHEAVVARLGNGTTLADVFEEVGNLFQYDADTVKRYYDRIEQDLAEDKQLLLQADS